MALYFKLCILSFKPQIIITTKAQLSHSFNPAKLDSLHIAIKWKIVQEERSTALLTKTRLNIDYHFQEEIEAFLRRQYVNSSTIPGGYYGNDIHEIALCFRLLRQQGFFVPEEVFGKFTNKEGKFNQKLGENIMGMVDLYEASQLGIIGEDILAEAGEFSGQVLKEKVDCIDNLEAMFVKRTLEHPFHKSFPMFTARNFFGDFHGTNNTWLDSLKEVVKWISICGNACTIERSLKFLNDIFDVYGTLDELTIFTEAVCRWDITAIEQLPDYMKACFRVLYNLTNEISSKVYQKHGWNPIDSLLNAWKSLCKAFPVEAKWFASGRGACPVLRNT
ncbi:(3S,6E)-nerolidol synthase 2, chloroplastic/mitochondrial [Glycine soja]|uniref:(3S,6E)-nerolidol synthase 2, chloroplastic/mitochondrial n=1 Tax=Glycine soja TaxID=3848 RepID=A0A0B2SNB5_GLYSO|nr:(3S,6E)-nerolidol synthase 2, chloroplastic/mitochondrial [Glycine soja]